MYCLCHDGLDQGDVTGESRVREGAHHLLAEFDVVGALALGQGLGADEELGRSRPVRGHDVILPVEDLTDVFCSPHTHRGTAEQVGLEQPTMLAEFLFVKLRTLQEKNSFVTHGKSLQPWGAHSLKMSIVPLPK